jgi:hypothetical protein
MTDQPQSAWNPSSQFAAHEQEDDHPLSDRRQRSRSSQEGMERRQFGSNYSELTAAGAELGKAIDSYKVANRRRYVTYDEILLVLGTLGYERRGTSAGVAAPTSAEEGRVGLPVKGLESIDSTSMQAID